MIDVEEQVDPIEDGLGKIEVGTRQLKLQYDMFFQGILPRQPYEARREIETIIYNLRKTQMQRNVDRFRFNTLTAKYQSMVELWNKMLRAKEEGRLNLGMPGFVKPVRRLQAELEEKGKIKRTKTVEPKSFTIKNPTREEDSLRMFYDCYLAAKMKIGGKRVSFTAFRKQILAKTKTMKSKSGASSVIYSIAIEGNRVVIKARGAGKGARK